MKGYSASLLTCSDIDSHTNAGIWAADYVAGAFHMALKHNDKTFFDLLKPKFIGNGYLKLW